MSGAHASPTGAFCLPGGYLDEDGVCHREGQIRPLTGRDEEWLFSLPRSLRQAALTTELLARCVKRIGSQRATRATIRSLTIPDRDYLMLALRRATFGDTLALVLRCPSPGCGARMDVDLPLGEVPVTPVAPERSYLVAVGEHGAAPGRPEPHEIEIRLPRGLDQEALPEGAESEEASLRLLAACVLSIDGERDVGVSRIVALPDAVRDALEEAIARRLPGLDLDMETACPECGEAFTVPLDPPALLVEEVLRGRTTFEREIHTLAFHYHWPLRELLGLTRPRRQRCLKWLTSELEASAS